LALAKDAMVKIKTASIAFGALACGAVVTGAMAIGVLAIGAMTVRRLRVLEAGIEYPQGCHSQLITWICGPLKPLKRFLRLNLFHIMTSIISRRAHLLMQ
jgi:hypothetical protein